LSGERLNVLAVILSTAKDPEEFGVPIPLEYFGHGSGRLFG
jgi:hypothetical protein